MMSSLDIPSASALKFRKMRWRSTGLTTRLTSSQEGVTDPFMAAQVFSPSTSYWLARGTAPQVTFFSTTSAPIPSAPGRVARARRTA